MGVLGREKEGNGLCPVLMLASAGDETGSCGGEREDAWLSPLRVTLSRKDSSPPAHCEGGARV